MSPLGISLFLVHFIRWKMNFRTCNPLYTIVTSNTPLRRLNVHLCHFSLGLLVPNSFALLDSLLLNYIQSHPFSLIFNYYACVPASWSCCHISRANFLFFPPSSNITYTGYGRLNGRGRQPVTLGKEEARKNLAHAFSAFVSSQ